LTEISTGISHLTQLNTLNLSNNEIASIPDERSDLTDLEYLYMDSNLLTTLSENTPSQMSGIYYISLSYNCFDTSLMSTGLIAFINDRSQGTSWQSHRNTYCSFEDNETERNSLITLYNATDGAHWNNNEYRLDT
jgi:Leucine-rich repeat (LRR) protein